MAWVEQTPSAPPHWQSGLIDTAMRCLIYEVNLDDLQHELVGAARLGGPSQAAAGAAALFVAGLQQAVDKGMRLCAETQPHGWLGRQPARERLSACIGRLSDPRFKQVVNGDLGYLQQIVPPERRPELDSFLAGEAARVVFTFTAGQVSHYHGSALGTLESVHRYGLWGTSSRRDTTGGASTHGLLFAFAATARGLEAAERSHAPVGRLGSLMAKLVYHIRYEGLPEHTLADAAGTPVFETLVPACALVLAVELVRVGPVGNTARAGETRSKAVSSARSHSAEGAAAPQRPRANACAASGN